MLVLPEVALGAALEIRQPNRGVHALEMRVFALQRLRPRSECAGEEARAIRQSGRFQLAGRSRSGGGCSGERDCCTRQLRRRCCRAGRRRSCTCGGRHRRRP
eukprot:Amastigsp_a510249_39.p6 type:complete len:102 gc:universal Amastigsp_a510249_39:1590-1895(+)